MTSARPKPRVSLRGYDPGKYTVLVARKDGNVHVVGAWNHKGTAFRMSSQNSPSKDPRTHRSVVARPGNDLLTVVNWLIEGLPEAMALYYQGGDLPPRNEEKERQ